jgi:antitoxin CptB
MTDALAIQRRRLRFRSWHRGTREADLILGRFADAHLADFSAEQLDRYGALLENSDPDIYDWLTGRAPIPAADDTDVFRLLMDFQFRGGEADHIVTDRGFCGRPSSRHRSNRGRNVGRNPSGTSSLCRSYE